jgi:aarF domain-containing kinase
MEWITGVKLTLLPQDEIRTLAKIGQEAFLTQLLDIGAPWPGDVCSAVTGSPVSPEQVVYG